MNETLRRMKESGAADGTGSAITEEMNDPNGYFNSMFSTGPSPMGAHGAKEISLDLIDPWRDAEHDAQPFKPYSAEKLAELAENIRQNGVISPVRLRLSPFEKGRYQILAGHNRVAASKLAGRITIPAILMQATDDEAKLILVDSNLYQRENLAPSERAFAYKMQLETLKHQGKRNDLTSGNVCQKSDEPTSGNVCQKFESRDSVAANAQVSSRTIQNFIRLTYLASPLLDMVDTEAIPFTAGVSISFLSPEVQQLLLTVMTDNDVKSITRSQGEELKAFRSTLDEETILRIFGKSKHSAAAQKPQSIKLQVDYAPSVVKRLAKDEVADADSRGDRRLRAGDDEMSDILDQLFAGTLQTPKVMEQTAPPVPAIQSGDMLQELPVDLLEDFPADKHPFRPYTQEKLESLQQDIRERGIIQPLIVRPMGEHRYQIISGHNRRTAARAIGYSVLPCILRKLDDDEALLQMISTNLQQRQDLRFSEKAFAYKMQMEALKHQGLRVDSASSQVETRLRSDEIIAQNSEDSRATIQRYIRLTHLIPSLLDAVDEKKIGFTIGESLSYLAAENQQIVENFFMCEQHLGIDQRTADKLRELEGAGELTEETLRQLFLSAPVKPLRKIQVNYKEIKSYFKEEATEKEIQETIQAALKFYFAKNTKGERP